MAILETEIRRINSTQLHKSLTSFAAGPGMLWEKGPPAAFSFSIRVAIPPGTNPRPIFGSPLFPGGSIYKQIRHQIRISRARKPLTRVSQVHRRSGTMRTRKTGHFHGATAYIASRPLAETPSRAAGRICDVSKTHVPLGNVWSGTVNSR